MNLVTVLAEPYSKGMRGVLCGLEDSFIFMNLNTVRRFCKTELFSYLVLAVVYQAWSSVLLFLSS